MGPRNELETVLKMFEIPKSDIYEMQDKYRSYESSHQNAYVRFWERTCKMLIDKMVETDASPAEIERVVKFSNVVLLSDDNRLNIAKACDDFDIQSLTDKYLGGVYIREF